jgi:hypothetical protein
MAIDTCAAANRRIQATPTEAAVMKWGAGDIARDNNKRIVQAKTSNRPLEYWVTSPGHTACIS